MVLVLLQWSVSPPKLIPLKIAAKDKAVDISQSLDNLGFVRIKQPLHDSFDTLIWQLRLVTDHDGVIAPSTIRILCSNDNNGYE